MPRQTQASRTPTTTGGDSLADVLERVLETGIVIAGDIRVQLADIELLTVQIRLVVCSVDRAQEMGMDWWQNHDFIQGDDTTGRSDELEDLDRRLERLETMQHQLLDRIDASIDETDPADGQPVEADPPDRDQN